MANVKLSIPVLVQNIRMDNGLHYRLRPLFLDNPFTMHRRYELAISKFQKEIKHYFNDYVLDRNHIDDLLWFNFNRNVQYKVHSFQITVGKQFIKGNFGVAHFTLQGKTFICLPSIDNFMFIAQQEEGKKLDVGQQAKRAIQHIFRTYKSATGIPLDPEEYYATKGEFVTVVTMNLDIAQGAFKFERQEQSWFFSRINSGTDFDGAVEIERYGYDINSRYPAELKRAHFREE